MSCSTCLHALIIVRQGGGGCSTAIDCMGLPCMLLLAPSQSCQHVYSGLYVDLCELVETLPYCANKNGSSLVVPVRRSVAQLTLHIVCNDWDTAGMSHYWILAPAAGGQGGFRVDYWDVHCGESMECYRHVTCVLDPSACKHMFLLQTVATFDVPITGRRYSAVTAPTAHGYASGFDLHPDCIAW